MPLNTGIRVGVYVDVANIGLNGGYRMQFDVLRNFACRDGGIALRLNAYVVYDEVKGQDDVDYRKRMRLYHAAIRDMGFKVIEKRVRWYTDESGSRYGKANTDLDMAVDVLLQSENLDRLLLATGDGDFVRVVKALQNKGCRVEVLGFRNVSNELRREADQFMSGYLVPNLLPLTNASGPVWGELGGRVRGYCYHYDDDKGFGFIRFLKVVSDKLHVTDGRVPDSPYGTAFFHVSNLPDDIDPRRLPTRDLIFEFTVQRFDDDLRKDPVAVDIETIA